MASDFFQEPTEERAESKRNRAPSNEQIQKRFDACYNYNKQIGLYEAVHTNENFFIGNQWEGVESNGLPTPVFNMLGQVVLFHVSTISSENMAISCSPMASVSTLKRSDLERIAEIVNHQFVYIMERNRIVSLCREMLRDAAVDGDGCMYFHFDPTIENGQLVKGEIVAEVLQNTRVHFGNPNCRDVQRQPYIILSRRELVEDVRYRAKKLKKDGMSEIQDPKEIMPDDEKFQNKYDSYTDDKVTVLTYMYRDRETGTIWYLESTAHGLLKKAEDTGYTLYPLVWMNWNKVQDNYHGQGMITSLIPNQKFINKLFAMAGISTMYMAFPKYIYDKNRIKNWDGSVASAVGVNGPVDGVVTTVQGAPMSPQVPQIMQMCMSMTKSLLGATDVALGDSRPDNTSAIIALQRAANTPMEITKQNYYQCVEDMGRIWMDMMSVNYGVRAVEMAMDTDGDENPPLGMQLPKMTFVQDFDFETLKNVQMDIKQDVGASSYYSEMASMQTLDNLFINNKISTVQYLERLPSGHISKKEELIEELKAQEMMAQAAAMPQTAGVEEAPTSNELPVQGGPGNGSLQRALNREGV